MVGEYQEKISKDYEGLIHFMSRLVLLLIAGAAIKAFRITKTLL